MVFHLSASEHREALNNNPYRFLDPGDLLTEVPPLTMVFFMEPTHIIHCPQSQRSNLLQLEPFRP
jgi:hypothetical protein